MAQSPVKVPAEKTVLNTLDRSHPRLILKDADLEALKKLIETDAMLKTSVEKLIGKADYVCRKPMLIRKLKGPRLLSVSRECVQRMYTLGLAYRLTGREKYAEKMKENLLAVCAFSDWNPSHFLDTAEMSHAVGIGYDWVYHYLDEPTRKKIRAGLIKHGMKPGVASYTGRKKVWWTGSSDNWNQVCNGGLMIGALAIAETDPEYARTIVASGVGILPKALASYAPDGAWGEGPGYWQYATSYTVYALASLDSALGTDFGLSKMAELANSGNYIIQMTGPNGMFFNYADCGSRPRGPGNNACLFWLAKKYDRPEYAEFERKMMKKRPGDPLDIIWYLPATGRKVKPLPLDSRFRGLVELVTFRSSWDSPDALYVGFKAGRGAIGHAQLDFGSFVMNAMGVRWAIDLGSDNYNLPGYWERRSQHGKRWKYYRLGSLSHNVPLIDNENQRVVAVTKFVKFKGGAKKSFAVADLTTAYRKNQVNSVKRGIMTLDNKRVLVQDEFDLKNSGEISWGMMTDAKITLDGSRAVLKQDGKELVAEILEPAGAVFVVESAEQKPPEQRNKGVKRLIVRSANRKGKARIAVLLTPSWPGMKKQPAPKLNPLDQW